MKKYYILLFAVIAVTVGIIIACKTGKSGIQTLEEPATPVHWVSMDEAVQASKKDGKMIWVDVYTDWCGWCKKMDKSTYRDTALIRYMNTYFHAVRLDAEAPEMQVDGRKYAMSGQFNEYAVGLLAGQMAFPTTVVLEGNGKGLFKEGGYIDAQTMRLVAAFFAEGAYKKGILLRDYVNMKK